MWRGGGIAGDSIAGDGGGLQGVGDVRLVELVRVLAVPGAFNYRPLSGGLLTREVEPEPRVEIESADARIAIYGDKLLNYVADTL